MVIRRFIWAGGLALILAGCGEGGGIKDAVKARLKDPDSVKFDEIVVSKKGDRACVVWNAKNSFGGYGNASIAELKKLGDAWNVIKMEGHRLDCTEEGFRVLAAGEEAEAAARRNAIERLKKLGKITSVSEEVDAEMGKGPCGTLLWKVGYHAKGLAEENAHDSPKPGGGKFHETELAKKLSKVEAGDCSRD